MNILYNQEKNAFSPITENPIILDLSSCKYLGEIHLILKEKFGLPDYYGENLDALWDLLDDRFSDGTDYAIEIYGYKQLEKPLRDYCLNLLKLFDEISVEHPNVIFKFIS